MRFFIEKLINPLCQDNGLRHVCEVGAHHGVATEALLKNPELQITTVDPCLDDDLERKFGSNKRITIRKGLSLDALPMLDSSFDAVLIDGDHNWYTVFEELKAIEKFDLVKPGGAIFLHDVRWPYARRDMYYQPEVIPPKFVHAHAKKGIVKGQRKLSETSDYLSSLSNAIYEGGKRNGVLTAIEDFLQQSEISYIFYKCRIEYGLGILIRVNDTQGFLYRAKWIYRIRRFELQQHYLRSRYSLSKYLEENFSPIYHVLKRLRG